TFSDLIEEETYITGVSALYGTEETAIINLEFIYDPVGIHDDPIPIVDYQLYNYPNPFNPETKIVLDLPEPGRVRLEIYNIKGQKVITLLDCYMDSGRSETLWNSKDDNGKRVSSGVYFYKLDVNGKTERTKKMLLLK
ncbi:MAG: T9SS type A sorting domain-containing protein, partial [Candidatus Tenebribacter mawsonii]|nr:T9SS type A sorting domain-containing protein [Candidatus Tenebribacter mawsonii]